MVRAGVYARISSDREGDNLAIGRQLADCDKLAHSRGWQIVERYIDADLSAWTGKRRPEYERLLADIEDGVIDAVVVYHADRLHRHPRELEDFILLTDRMQIRLATVSGEVDLSSDDGKLIARITGAVARKESDDKSRRTRRKHEELALAGKVAGGGTRPYGFEDDRRTLRADEALVIRDAARRLLAGEPLRALCADLNSRRVPTVTGGQWKTQTLRRLLSSGRISGQREHRGQIVAAAEWPAIISSTETARIRALLADPSRRTNRTPRRYLLVQLLRCSHCGEKLVSRPREDGSRRYVCAKGPNFSGCGKTTILAETLEGFVVEAVLHRLDSPEVAAGLRDSPADPDGERWRTQIDQADEQLQELARAYADQTITMREWLAARRPIEERATVAKKRLSTVNRTTALAPYLGNAAELRGLWPQLTLSRQRAVVAALLDHVMIGPARRGYNRFDPTRLAFNWRA
jgi:site-specific DNA recombinase